MATALKRWDWRRILSIMVVATSISGCAALDTSPGSGEIERQRQIDAAFDKARADYEKGAYRTAMEQFVQIAADSQVDTVRRNAQLGEICCRLMLAETPADYQTARWMWLLLSRSLLERESDPALAMLDPVLLRLTTELSRHPPPVKRSKAPEKRKSQLAEKDDRSAAAEIAALKKKVRRAAQLQLRLDQLAAENLALKEKIMALEAIDQTIQKKKTEISSPSE